MEDGDPVDFSLGTAGAYVEGVGQKQEIMRTKDHVDLNDTNADDNVAYNSVPPTSGDHWSTPVRCGFYIEPVPDELIVHNMEHSNIVVSYNLPEQAGVDALEGCLRRPTWPLAKSLHGRPPLRGNWRGQGGPYGVGSAGRF